MFTIGEKPFVFIREQCCKILIITTVASVSVSRFPSSETEEKEKHFLFTQWPLFILHDFCIQFNFI